MIRTWESLSLLEQATESLLALSGIHRMQISPDWPHTRTLAALDAERRIRRYELERAARMELYARGGAAESYRRRWRSFGGVTRVVQLDPERFSRALGEGR
jgi:hypothetical protein